MIERSLASKSQDDNTSTVDAFPLTQRRGIGRRYVYITGPEMPFRCLGAVAAPKIAPPDGAGGWLFGVLDQLFNL
jgi:hypothetical protein